jgi:hypothetical protein
MLLEVRVCLHGDKVLNVAKGGLDDAVVIGFAVKLWTGDFPHKSLSLGRIVSLRLVSSRILSYQDRQAHHLPAHNPVLHHCISDQWSVDLGHVAMVVVFAHSGLPVGTDSPAEETLRSC